MTDSSPHSELEPAALVELAVAVGQWLGAESAPIDVIHAQERVVEWAKRLEEQLEAKERERIDWHETAVAERDHADELEEQLETARSELAEATKDEIAYFKEAEQLKEQLEAARHDNMNWRREAVDQQERYLQTKEQYEALREAAEEHLNVCSRAAGVQAPLRQALYPASVPPEGRTYYKDGMVIHEVPRHLVEDAELRPVSNQDTGAK